MYNTRARYKMHAVDCFLFGPASYDQSTVVLELRHQLTLHGTGEISEVSPISVWKVHNMAFEMTKSVHISARGFHNNISCRHHYVKEADPTWFPWRNVTLCPVHISHALNNIHKMVSMPVGWQSQSVFWEYLPKFIKYM